LDTIRNTHQIPSIKGIPVSPSRKIKRQSLPETLTESLRERILNGEFKEGDALIQDAIAQEYDVSRMPVREALRQLEACGLVVMQLHKGAVVTSVPNEQIAELFELRALLECELLARAIPRMTAEHLATSQSILTALEASYRRRCSQLGSVELGIPQKPLPGGRPGTDADHSPGNQPADRSLHPVAAFADPRYRGCGKGTSRAAAPV
jgi:DNA-binding FadR family transcriptional regulator